MAINQTSVGRNAIAQALIDQKPGMGQTNVGGGYVINDPAYGGAPHFYRDYNFQSPPFKFGNDPNDVDYDDLIQGRVTYTNAPFYTDPNAVYGTPNQSAGGPDLLHPGFSNTGNLEDQNIALAATPTSYQPYSGPPQASPWEASGGGSPLLQPGFSNTGNPADQAMADLTASDLGGQAGVAPPPVQPAAMGAASGPVAGLPQSAGLGFDQGGTAANPYQGYQPPGPMGAVNPLLQQSEQDMQQPVKGGIYSEFD